jgi:osmotically-inducible protein OsmY
MRVLLLLLVALSTLSLQACFPIIATGVGMTAFAVADRRTIGAQAEDQGLQVKVANRLAEQFGTAKYSVNVNSYNRRVLLTGEAASEEIKNRLTELAKEVPNVASVVNEVQVAGNSAFSARSNDALITTKVKSRFVTEGKTFHTNHVKVVTEAGVVYLMGLVTPAEGDAAVEIARTTSGVQSVVKVFEYIDKVPASETTAKQ